MKTQSGHLYLIVSIILLVAANFISWHRPINRTSEIDDVDSTESVVVETSTITIYDVLELRKELRHAKYIDSVFFAMPEEAIVAILTIKGTELAHSTIVNTYLADKDFYDNLMKDMVEGKSIKDCMDKQKSNGKHSSYK